MKNKALKEFHECLSEFAVNFGYETTTNEQYLSLYTFITKSPHKQEILKYVEQQLNITPARRRSLMNEYYTREVMHEMVYEIIEEGQSINEEEVVDAFKQLSFSVFCKTDIPARYGSVHDFVRKAILAYLNNKSKANKGQELIKEVKEILEIQ